MYIDGKEFKHYEGTYYVSKDGQVYSTAFNKIMKHNITKDGHHRVDIYRDKKPKHEFVHHIVWKTWVGPIPKGMQVNHKDDNKNNNSISNLYLGTQKENIADEFKNKKRMGHRCLWIVYDSEVDEFIPFPSVDDFLKYSGHKCANRSIEKIKKKKWFQDRYAFIRKERVETIETYKEIIKAYKKILKSL